MSTCVTTYSVDARFPYNTAVKARIAFISIVVSCRDPSYVIPGAYHFDRKY